VGIKHNITNMFIWTVLMGALSSADASAHGSSHKMGPQGRANAQPATPNVDIDSRFRNALSAGNAELAASFLSDDVLVFEEGSVERSKSEYQSHHLAADIAFARATRYEVLRRAVKVWGDTAISTSEGRTTGEWRGRTVNSLGTETIVMRKENGQWRIIHIHWSSRNAPASPPQ
jgi:ketosteroid isomerase-like protein